MYGPEPRLPNTKRPAIPLALTTLIFARDGSVCRYCGVTGVTLNLDHVFAFVQGGDATEDNLVVSCRVCNLLASDRFYVGGFDHKKDWLVRARKQLGANKLRQIREALDQGNERRAKMIAEGDE